MKAERRCCVIKIVTVCHCHICLAACIHQPCFSIFIGSLAPRQLTQLAALTHNVTVNSSQLAYLRYLILPHCCTFSTLFQHQSVVSSSGLYSLCFYLRVFSVAASSAWNHSLPAFALLHHHTPSAAILTPTVSSSSL